jgi:hypothetical protein
MVRLRCKNKIDEFNGELALIAQYFIVEENRIVCPFGRSRSTCAKMTMFYFYLAWKKLFGRATERHLEMAVDHRFLVDCQGEKPRSAGHFCVVMGRVSI